MNKLIEKKEVRFLSAGVINTLFGYFLGLLIYLMLQDYCVVVVIALLANVIAIFFSFLTYKLFVFRTKGNWLKECCKCYISYSVGAVIGSFLISYQVEQILLPFWVAQAISILFTTVLSFIFHNYFTFRTGQDQ